MTTTYREIPSIVTAMPVPDPNVSTSTAADVHEVATWAGGAVFICITPELGAVRVISLPEVDGFAQPGDYIIKSESGNVHVCPGNVFATLYEPMPA